MKKLVIAFIALQSLVLSGEAFAVGPPLPAGWRLAEWWDLDGRDRPDLMADFTGDGTIDLVTVAVREDSQVVGLLLWNAAQSGPGKWMVLDQQKRRKSLLGLRLEAQEDADHANRSKIVYCRTTGECLAFAWDDKDRKFGRTALARKPAS